MFSTIGYYICIPFAWLVRLFYSLTNSYGMAIILFTLVITWIVRRLDGVFEDQKHYLLRLQEERERNNTEQ